MLRYMAIGDVTSPKAAHALASKLWDIRRAHTVDFVAVNAENAGFIIGPSPELAKCLLDGGADVLTGGNHTLRQKLLYRMLEENNALLRPINFPENAPGVGYNIFDVNGYRVLLINAMGNVHIDPTLDSPYPYIDRVLAREEGRYDLALIEIHAEATGEKLALGYAYDGRVSAVWGTHTHVPTADEQILPLGTGYITDVGMCGESGGVLGMDPALVVERMRTKLPIRFQKAAGRVIAGGVIFTIDEKTKKTTSVRRISF